MKQKVFAWLLAAALVFALAGCGALPSEELGSSEADAASEAQRAENETEPAADDGQNPVMNFVGVYSTEYSVEALVEAEGAENAKITVTYAGSPWFHNRTVMSGRFDPETLTISFTDAALTEYTFNSDGSVREEKLILNDGTGRAMFSQDGSSLTITQDSPSGSVDTVYAWGPSADMKNVTDPAHYASVTAMDKFEVETVVGFNARTAYLSENWFALADMIRYPITINGSVLTDADAFLGYMVDKTVSESDRAAMMEEDFLDMFVNDQGIMMGDGEIWLSDPNYGTDAEPRLEIIAINGIVSRNPEAAIEPDQDRDFYDTESVVAYDEMGNVYTLYESSDGYWRTEPGDTYIRLSETEFQHKDGTLRLTVDNPLYDEADRDHYTGVTAMDKTAIKTGIAAVVRKAYLDENWYVLADYCRYPITINGTELSDSFALIDYLEDKTISESDRQAMADENLYNMFVNGQGICMGSGQIWLNDPNYGTDAEPRLEIIAISGIVSKG